ncbi:molybdate ABC transporter substrate-binding protein [Pseudohongiella spirulinae]|uniref:Molybdenum ABC transporter periplasmic molybdate-binding protein n=1 Tax=Pseudohongiella spirulinae TaxID=1249552 RepID=A0A0S2KGB7_9GAMM|nr:molybdate ABC transporter substrate-binding protein [Pseudohongiella spirulinae]ALO47007.1 Molybdenum ABC transporter periplasmic molybdate-binding protein [Pseudohongiella spirulinae]
MKFWLFLCFLQLSVWSGALRAQEFTIAAASDLRFALDEIVALFAEHYPEYSDDASVIYGSSGRLTTQIINGAPFDVFFSADIAFPQRLYAEGLTAIDPAVYATGRIVLWSARMDASQMTLNDLLSDDIRRIAIAQPAHAPYGMRAREALQSVGVWQAVESKLVFGENIAQAAQMAESGAADVGIIALSLALFPSMQIHPYALIDDSLHEPLTQAFVLTLRGRGKPSAQAFAEFMSSEAAREIMTRYGFVMPEAN